MKRNRKIRKTFPAQESAIEEILDYSESCLQKQLVNRKLLGEYRLVIEEVLIKMIAGAAEQAEVGVESSENLGEVYLRLTCRGKQAVFEAENADDFGGKVLEEYRDYLSPSYVSGINQVDFTSSGNLPRKRTMIAFAAAVVCGLLIRAFCTEAQMDYLSDELAYPLIRFYAGCMQMIAAPLVFFSMVWNIIRLQRSFDHNADLIITAVNYIVTSLVAILIGYAVVLYYPFARVTPNFSFLLDDANFVTYPSPKEFITMLTCTNLLEIFQIDDPRPLLLLSALFGIAAAQLHGKEARLIRHAVRALSGIFSKMLAILYDVMPVFLFISVAQNVFFEGPAYLLDVLAILLQAIPVCVPLMLFYAVILAIFGVSPIRFLRDYGEILRENYLIGSNISALPYNKRMITRKIGGQKSYISDRLTLGAMFNMDGNCLLLAAYTMYILHICYGSVQPGFLATLTFIIILLSTGAPNQPGSFLLGMVFIMGITGISSDMYDFAIIVEAFLGTAYSFVNSVGDIVCVTAAASRKQRKEKRREQKAG